MLNIDKIREKLRNINVKASVKAIIDSTWVLDLPYGSDCDDGENCLAGLVYQRLKS